MENIRLGIFDIDGTIRNSEGIPPEVIEGFRNLYSEGVITTILTGRGYKRAREALGLNYPSLVRRGILVGLENGSRITKWGGRQNIIYHPLHSSEITAVVDATLMGDVNFVAYFPEKTRRKAVVWTPNASNAEQLQKKYGHFAVVSHLPPSSFEHKAKIDNPSMLAIKPLNDDWITALPNGINASTNEGLVNVNRRGIDKGTGLSDIRELLGFNPTDVLFAGNDHNDIPAFVNNATGSNILVGPNLSGLLTVPYHYINNVPELGTYLQRYKSS